MRRLSVVVAIAGVVLLAVSFVPLGAQASDQFAIGSAAHGKAVFQGKGCAACHAHAAVDFASFNVGPALTNYRADPAYLARWLRDPQAIKPATEMPNLNLSDDEIDSLVAFLNEE